MFEDDGREKSKSDEVTSISNHLQCPKTSTRPFVSSQQHYPKTTKRPHPLVMTLSLGSKTRKKRSQGKTARQDILV